ncbi:MAG TPA: acyl-CoA thioester hydrolase/BAAT C-terminal domain-containing protein [Candidatus Acidoferrales bacterium]|nr:acyl-CoA thioester hydrolase/BAAT C-terminal domain-containing protein [Candidatus Acidoferrales bacterium]
MIYDDSKRALGALSAAPAGRGVHFEISPDSAFVDEDVRVCLNGLAAASLISIDAATEDGNGRRWNSQARFRADSSGVADVSLQESLAGSYRGVAPMGLFWSMESACASADGNSSFARSSSSPDRVDFKAVREGRVLARASLVRNFLAPGTVTRDWKIPNEAEGANTGAGTGATAGEITVGRLFIPAGRGPHPVVIVLSGSGGGFDLDKAAVLSRHGFATLALAYFGIAPLPTWLHRIPLEYFQTALSWLHAQPEINPQRTGILAVSRGAELALLLGAALPQQIRAIVAYAPSSVAWAASGRGKASGELIPCWMWRGKPVPFAPLPLRGFMWRSAFPVLALRRPVMFRNLFRAGLRNRDAVERAAIPVENIRGPLLLISGGDDHLWPAAEMSEAIVARLKRHGSSHASEHLHFPHAGHMLRYPHLPVTARHSRNKHLRGARFSFGGTPSADAAAQSQAWRRAITFLRAHL